MIASTKCLIPGCKRPPKTRGLCTSCYATATKMKLRNETTFDELQTLGLMLSPAAGRPESNPLRMAFAAAKAKSSTKAKSLKK